jgi:hypothetical protein
MLSVFALGVKNVLMSSSSSPRVFTVISAIVTIAPNTLYSFILITDRVEPISEVNVSHVYST